MFGNLGRRLFEATVGLFALLGFVYVPLGHRTGLDHALAVLSTPAARAAFDDLSQAALGLRQRAVDLLSGSVHTPARPKPGPEPKPPALN